MANEINSKTKVPAAILYGAVVLTAVAAWQIRGQLSEIRSELKAFGAHTQADWNFQDQETWALQLKNQNPSLNVPAPKDFRHPPPTTAQVTSGGGGNALTAKIP